MAAPANESVVKSEPAVLYGAIGTIVVAVAGLFDIVVEVGTVETLLAAAVPLVTAVLTRAKVTPVE